MTPLRSGRRRAAAIAIAALALASCSGTSSPRGRQSPPSSPARSAASTVPSGSARATVRGSSPARTHAASEPPGQFTMSFAGDVHFAGRIGDRLDRDPATVFGAAAPGLRRADLTMVNLETAVTTGGSAQAKEFTFRAPPRALAALRDAGIDVATMANNHGADYGAAGLQDSLAAERREHFPIVGIGADEKAAFAPYTTTLNGTRVAIFAADQVQDETTLRLFSAGPRSAGVANAFDPRLLSAVRTAHRAGYVVVVYVHWGIEYHTCASDLQSTLAGQLAAAGASAVVGAHAHVLQGAGWRKDGTFVAYGLGNYLWWRSFGNDQDDNGVLTLTFRGGKVVSDAFAPSHLDQHGVPVPATGAQARRIDAEFAADRQCTSLSATPPG